MKRQEEIDRASDYGAAIFLDRHDARGSCVDLSDADLSIFGEDLELVSACVSGFDEIAREYGNVFDPISERLRQERVALEGSMS